MGSYYVKELSRSEGFELSVNACSRSGPITAPAWRRRNLCRRRAEPRFWPCRSFRLPWKERTAGGTGYDQLNFSVTSSGTADADLENGGYDILISGFPEGIEVYRVDTGEEEVTGPHVTGPRR